MPKKKKTWQEKMADGRDLPKVIEITENMIERWGSGTMCIPAPMEVDEIMNSVPRGKLITINQIREIVAKRHGATIGCPITTGLFVGIAAHAADEMVNEGKTDITPYWRTIKSKGELNDKYPGGAEDQAARLKEEGHTILLGKNNKPRKVKDFEKALVEVPV